MHLRPFVPITPKPDAVDRVLLQAAAVVLRYTYAQTTESVSGIFVPATGESQLRVVVGPVQALFPAQIDLYTLCPVRSFRKNECFA